MNGPLAASRHSWCLVPVRQTLRPPGAAMPTPTPAIICSGLSFAWPDGTPVFSDVSLVIGPGRTGLIGLNGSGKSTLLRLIASELTPAHGSVQVAGELGYVPQNVTLAGARVDEAL